MPALSLPAPAKINLFLHICGRRDDGYHNLQTVFHFLEIHDQLSFTQRDDGEIHLLTDFPDVPTEDNLIVKAARLLQQHSHSTLGVDISIDKNLPMGGGIGGGSSNAATTLIGLNQLWQLGLSHIQLKQLGIQLGADVPIFIHGHSAWAEGIGENLTDIQVIEKWYILAIPDCHVSTNEIFSNSRLTRDSKMMKIAAFLEQGNSNLFRNDCEAVVRNLYPEIDNALKTLSNFGEARMTGTGACIFMAFETKDEALEISKKLPKNLTTLVTKGKKQSSLFEALATNS